jgi:hypothetical protein
MNKDYIALKKRKIGIHAGRIQKYSNELQYEINRLTQELKGLACLSKTGIITSVSQKLASLNKWLDEIIK